MKEIITPFKKVDVKLHAEKQVEKKTVFLGSEQIKPGHRCFEINVETLEIKEVEYEKLIHFNRPDERRVMVKEGYVYVNALNKKNALKVYTNGGRETSEPYMKIGEINNSNY